MTVNELIAELQRQSAEGNGNKVVVYLTATDVRHPIRDVEFDPEHWSDDPYRHVTYHDAVTLF
jgi:hypothetical protein